MALDWKQTSQWWYGRFSVNGRSKLVNLNIKIAGTRPESINAIGPGVDGEFILSRGKALQEHDRLRDEIRSRSNLQEVQQKIIELKTGGRMESVKLADLPEAWARIPRRRDPGEDYATYCKTTLGRFAAFMAEKWRGVDDLASVSRDHVAAFMEAETGRGVAPKTWNETLKLLRRIFRHYQPEADAYRRYLTSTPSRQVETVFRKPFTPEELKAILAAAQRDEFIRPIIVTGICTAMRRGDVCLLKWADVDLARGFISVKTAKTGATVSIPIFPLLNNELKKRTVNGSEYVFQEAAEMYQKNPYGIGWRIKKVLTVAMQGDGEGTARSPEPTPAETRAKGIAYIEGLNGTPKALRMKAVFNAYLDGKSGPEIVAEQGGSKASVSAYLNEIESNIGCRFVRGRPMGESWAALEKSNKAELLAARETGRRRASVRNFHAFRTTWITVALNAGVPLELVRRVTGHTAAEVVLKHYYRPGEEAFRQALQSVMPALMTDGVKSRDERLREAIVAIKSKTLKRDIAKALAILDGA
jgi:integrase